MPKVKIYVDPYTRKNSFEVVELISFVQPKTIKKLKTNEDISNYHLFKNHGIKKGLVKYSDGSMQDNVWFNPEDIINN